MQENTEVIKYEVRSTKYEVKELGATELRGCAERKRSRKGAWGINQSTREDEAPLVRRASESRMGISMAAFLENFLGTGVIHKGLRQICWYDTSPEKNKGGGTSGLHFLVTLVTSILT